MPCSLAKQNQAGVSLTIYRNGMMEVVEVKGDRDADSAGPEGQRGAEPRQREAACAPPEVLHGQ